MADAKLVAELRAKTNAGMMACKKALDEAGDDMEKAMELLRKSGELKAAQKTAERTTAEGIFVTYVHHNKKMAAMLELQCESDFVALNEDFVAFANDLVMQVAAMGPLYVSPEQVPEADLAKQKELFAQEMANDNKPEEIKVKIMQGKIDKWLNDVCLTKQDFFKDDDKTIEQMVNEKIATIGEKIVIARFVRWEIGAAPKAC
ncbi:MAG: translation elongation factor Ts [Patescibacteria group bacterium]|nr:translation elongation factor Ts [Patescibacteria group bacterium]